MMDNKDNFVRSVSIAIDYDEVPKDGQTIGYRGFVVTEAYENGNMCVQRFRQYDDPVNDWVECLNWIVRQRYNCPVLQSSSLTHFVHDVPGYRWINNADGIEILERARETNDADTTID